MPASEQPTPRPEWGRPDLTRLADRLLVAARPFASSNHALIAFPGPEGGYGRAVDGLEGFARTFLLAGFRLAGERGADPDGLAEWYAEGLAAGTDPTAPDRWIGMDEHPQAKVEAASIALILDLTRPWIWDQLSTSVQKRVVTYLAHAVGDDTYPRINWVWFRLVVQTFLRSVGGPSSSAEMAEDLATHDSFVRADGWLADGRERSFDHYVGWALHAYPVLWSRMAGAADLAAGRRERDSALLDRYLQDAVHLVGADGSPLIQGRSLSYRFAAAAPFWAGVLAEVPSVPAGQLRRAATRIVRHFAEHGAPDADGVLTTGWFERWPRLAQAYSGPGSPYWAAKGLLGVALPADHPVWNAPEVPLPVEDGDTLRIVRAPGWVVAGTQADGIVRVVNHGTDHAEPGATLGDSPLYARLGYSTATFPLLDEASWASPSDQSVGLTDAAGRMSHRAGMRMLELGMTATGDVAYAASRVDAHWLTPDPVQQHHGYGYVGEARPAGTLTVVSIVRGGCEVRAVRVESLAGDPTPSSLVFGGWPVAGEQASAEVTSASAVATAAGIASRMVAVLGSGEPGAIERLQASPLGDHSLTPRMAFAPQPGTWTAVLLELFARGRAGDERTCAVSLTDDGPYLDARISWPDGATSELRIQIGRSIGPASTAPDHQSQVLDGPDVKKEQ